MNTQIAKDKKSVIILILVGVQKVPFLLEPPTCTSCTRGVQENGAIFLIVIQTAEILGLIICFAIHFLCVTIE